ncbi:Hypothetical protein NTJ_01882 [Nesidiocoris tenuis]|uniref:Uncharacterized protein n=1 Tax=Nesidiocoris tenuis TaxID=355587 RepID=A0ABN7AA15_9HEMI|nr:Hypothetical protein NTJ_01882 [Nesidiocoris tenuis]
MPLFPSFLRFTPASVRMIEEGLDHQIAHQLGNPNEQPRILLHLHNLGISSAASCLPALPCLYGFYYHSEEGRNYLKRYNVNGSNLR